MRAKGGLTMAKRNSVILAALAGVLGMAGASYATISTKIMPLGDSLTQGWVLNNNYFMPYRYEFYKDLTAANANFVFVGSDSSYQSAFGDPSQGVLPDAQKFHDGYGGYTIDDIHNNVDTFITASTPDSILLHIGTNDFWTYNETAAVAAGKLDSLVARIFQDSPNVHLYLASIVPVGLDNSSTTFVQSELYDQMIQNTIVPKYKGLGDNITFVDINSAFLNGNGTGNTALYDGIHPTKAGAIVMGDVFAQAVAGVPEPASALLLAAGAAGLLARRRR